MNEQHLTTPISSCRGWTAENLPQHLLHLFPSLIPIRMTHMVQQLIYCKAFCSVLFTMRFRSYTEAKNAQWENVMFNKKCGEKCCWGEAKCLCGKNYTATCVHRGRDNWFLTTATSFLAKPFNSWITWGKLSTPTGSRIKNKLRSYLRITFKWNPPNWKGFFSRYREDTISSLICPLIPGMMNTNTPSL